MKHSRTTRRARVAACTAIALAAGALFAGPAAASGAADGPHGSVQRTAPKADPRSDVDLPRQTARGTFRSAAAAAPLRFDADRDGEADQLYLAIDGNYYVAPGAGGEDVEFSLGQNASLDYKDVIPVGKLDGDAYHDLLTLSTDGKLSLFRGTDSFGTSTTAAWTGAGWNIYNKVFSPGDLTGDGRADVLARDHGGVLWIYKNNGTVSRPFDSRVKVGAGWQYYDHLIGTNDVNGDGIADLAARDTTGNLYTYLGTGNTLAPFKAAVKVGTGWNIYNQVVGTDDLNGDGLGDLIGRTTAGQLYVYYATGSGTWTARAAGAPDLSFVTQFAAQGGVPAFQRADTIARDSAGTLWWYYSKNNGTLSKRQQISDPGGWKDAKITLASALGRYNASDLVEVAGTKLYVNGKPLTSGWDIYNHLVGAGDLSGDGKGDLLARDKSGVLWLHQGNGSATGFSARVKIGAGWGAFTKLSGAGDLTGDGRGDLLARDGAGNLFVYPGTGQAGAPFAKPIKTGTGFNIYKQLLVAGDLTGDGRADLLATDASGVLYRYDSYGNAKLTARAKIGTGYQIYPNMY
ncbi:VCBS repeat-containing protein [Streptomyces sp. NPDC097619]|uniref:FG-GAP repeat domain-containing protein n=1 Tax=Streptomyces sp. NPDC097619 TaxID=3157228 RepID=UPI0033278FA9